jgi:riboflavin synthase
VFTGIIQDIATVIECTSLSDSGKRLVLCSSINSNRFQIGASVSCNGACLTIVEIHPVPATNEVLLGFDVGPTTLLLTELGNLNKGAKVNIEPSLRMGDDIGGHEVTGHIDCKAVVHSFEKMDEQFFCLKLVVPPEFSKYLISKGSISVKGVSLTIANFYENHTNNKTIVEIMLVPHTLKNTNLSFLQESHSLEIEFDKFTKSIVTQLDKIIPNYLSSKR